MSSQESSSEILPIFPLNVVLFPQAQLLLHIFEERYKKLINDCVMYSSAFGINLIHDQEIRTIGCTSVVKEIMKRYDDGRMDIVVEGRRRYSLLNLVEAPNPYYSGRVSWIEDIDEDTNTELLKRAVYLYNEFVKVVFLDSVNQVSVTDVRKARSFHLVQKAGLELVQRQVFLSMTSENRRLEFLVNHLESMVPLLASKRRVEELAKNDGYIQE